METKNLIQSNANVIRITNLKPGDLYKRFHREDVYYGIVRSINNDGENTYIESTEYRYSYGEVKIEFKVFSGTEDIAIFPCEVKEFNLEFDKALIRKEKEIEDYENKISDTKKQIKELESIINGDLLKELSVASYSELTQASYDEKKKALESL